jgi:hypothetical protein
MSSCDGRSRLSFSSVCSALIKHSAQSSQIRSSNSLSLQHKRAISVQTGQKSAYSETRGSRAMAADVVAVVLSRTIYSYSGLSRFTPPEKPRRGFAPGAGGDSVLVTKSVGRARVRFQLHGRIFIAFTTHRNGTKGPVRMSPQIERRLEPATPVPEPGIPIARMSEAVIRVNVMVHINLTADDPVRLSVLAKR